MDKKFFISTGIAFLVYFGLCFLVHDFLLRSEYQQIASFFRTDEDFKQYFKYLILAHLIMAGGLVWLYRKGKEAKPILGQGIRFGLAVAFVSIIPAYLTTFAVQPMPGMLVAKQILLDTIVVMITGIVIAKLES